MPNTYVSKVIYGNQTLIDLTNDTVVADKLLNGYTAHGADGAPITGTCDFDANTQDATATAAEILSGKTAYKAGAKVTGTMPNVGKQTGAIATKEQAVAISQGYHDGSGTVSISPAEQAKLIAGNIREGVTILGVIGTMSGSEDVKATSLSATPYTTEKTYLPTDSGDYNYFSQVSVAAIAYNETDNSAGGKTATIGTVAPA